MTTRGSAVYFPDSYAEVLSPAVQNVTLLGDRPVKRELRLTEVIRVVPNQCERGPYERGGQGTHRGKTV